MVVAVEHPLGSCPKQQRMRQNELHHNPPLQTVVFMSIDIGLSSPSPSLAGIARFLDIPESLKEERTVEVTKIVAPSSKPDISPVRSVSYPSLETQNNRTGFCLSWCLDLF